MILALHTKAQAQRVAALRSGRVVCLLTGYGEAPQNLGDTTKTWSQSASGSGSTTVRVSGSEAPTSQVLATGDHMSNWPLQPSRAPVGVSKRACSSCLMAFGKSLEVLW